MRKIAPRKLKLHLKPKLSRNSVHTGMCVPSWTMIRTFLSSLRCSYRFHYVRMLDDKKQKRENKRFLPITYDAKNKTNLRLYDNYI